MTDSPRVLIAKPGLDGHDRGAKVVAMALRDAGAEVLYLGLRQTVDDVIRVAGDEDVDVIGLSILSGTHNTVVGNLLERLATAGLGDVPVAVGGTIPPEDVATLEGKGVSVHPVGASLRDTVHEILTLARDRPADASQALP